MNKDNNITLYRKRHIPNETNNLKDDKILKVEDNLIITSWNALKPRKDIKRGLSVYYLDKGYKISKLYDAEDNIVYWYCDIVDTTYDEENNAYIFEDLLLDVIVYPDGMVKVMDADELADVLEKGIIGKDKVCKALKNMNDLLDIIYKGEFNKVAGVIDEVE